MNPYNETTPCKKCGATDAKTEYHDWTPVCGVQVFPLMRRECRRCSYVGMQVVEYADGKYRCPNAERKEGAA